MFNMVDAEYCGFAVHAGALPNVGLALSAWRFRSISLPMNSLGRLDKTTFVIVEYAGG